MAVRSRRLWGPTPSGATGTQTTLFTVPADRTAVVRAIWVASNDDAAGVAGRLFITQSGITRRLARFDLAAGASTQFQAYMVLNPGDVILNDRISIGGFFITGFGALLLGVPA